MNSVVLPAYSGSRLDCLPKLSAETIGAPDALDVKRISAGVGDIDVVHGDPQQAGRHLPHQLPGNVDGEFVRARERPRMGLEVVHRKLQQHFQLLQFKLAAPEFGRVERRLVVVPQQMVEVAGSSRHGRRQQMLRQNHGRARSCTIGWMVALSNPVETIAGSHNPRIRGLGRFRSLRKYSNTVGCSGGTAAKLLKVS